MDTFDREFVMELFLDIDSVTTMNRLIVATTDVVKENNENVSTFKDVFKNDWLPDKANKKDLRTTDERRNPPRTRQRWKCKNDNIESQYSEGEFEERFGLKKNTFKELLTYFKNTTKTDGMIIPLEKKVCVFLWLLTSDASFHEVGAQFRLHKSTISYIFHEIAEMIAETRHYFVSWPEIEEQNVTRLKVNGRHNFPNCVGFIDACRFRVGSKRNKRGKPDIVLLQAVCDESLMFIDLHVGNIGRTKKSKLYKESPLSTQLANFVEFENHILGDSQYKLRINLITPFKSEDLLTVEEMKFNEFHWKTRGYIGRAFEILKERFRKLNFIDISKPEAISTIIYAACVLHNFILIHEGRKDLFIKEETITCEEGVVIDTTVVKTASEKQQFLCNYINFMENELQ